MEIINIQAAKTHLSRLVEQAVEGEEVIIGKAMVKLVAVGNMRKPRVGGQLNGQISESADCWDLDQVDDSILASVDEPFPRKSISYGMFSVPAQTKIAEDTK
jgi:antitoxin (DNA-binding transcriptional repressor) of toxin-antitoxin stability system